MEDKKETGMAIFDGQEIRQIWHKEEWWFAVADVVSLLSESRDVKQYIKKMRQRDQELSTKWGTICTPLPMIAADGKKRKVTASNLEGIFRIIQSISSPKAEPFKQWLATTAKQRIEEMEDPERAIERMREDYRKLGYEEDWINKRLQSIDIRKLLTEEWQKRGVKKGKEYSILTAEISRGTFGVTPSDHKQHKGLERENLRDHMTNLELIFTMLGEEDTRHEAVKRDAQGFNENHEAAKEGGEAAGMAREAFELRSGRKVLSPENRKDQIKAAKTKARLEAEKKKLDK
ncbi:BRO-N domain-containing protein [Neolewinella agarilytica]|uniref:BRO family, N-terminal domain n=1 Tax=Neolewinella agarilytica TaxID=478744 RepID=A0A1H9HF97_9BACT|nr:Bro-N domain-containing protein [Neolewinella agarilytica]SEQ60876.1 BRO family, N-terminal domain [Neolewinella agarilytica]